jgi:serine/threonine protein kinase
VCYAAGLEYLHNEDIIHNDIKDKNVLVFNAGAKKVVKFTDFGSFLLSITITLNTA